MLPDIDSLALFVRAAELRSLSKAADASHIGPAAASRRIALLEHRFKPSLLERSPKGVELTPAGETLLTHAKAMLAQLNCMDADMRAHVPGVRALVRVVASTSALVVLLPEDIASFTRAYPDIPVVVEERWSTDIRPALLAGEADIGLLIEGGPIEGLETRHYRSDRLAIIAPPHHKLATQRDFTFESVLDNDLIALEAGSSMMRILTEQAVVVGKPLRLRAQVRSFEVVCRMVQCGLGIGILPYDAALAEGLRLAVRPFRESWAERKMLACTKNLGAPSLTATLLLNHLCAATTSQPFTNVLEFDRHAAR